MLIILASGLNLAGWYFYWLYQKAGLSKSNFITWLLSFLAVVNSAIGMFFVSGNALVGVYYLVALIPCALILWGCIGNGVRSTLFAKCMLPIAGFLLYANWKLPEYGLLLLSIYYAISYSIFAINLLKGKGYEVLTPWVFWVLSGLINILYLGLSGASSNAFILPTVVTSCWAIILFLSIKSPKLIMHWLTNSRNDAPKNS